MCLHDERIEVVAISELGQAGILNYLVKAEAKGKVSARIEGNFLVSDNGKARMLTGGGPGQVPWDMFDVDVVVDGTWTYRKREDMQQHLEAGAKRVMLTTVPLDPIDRVVVRGVNDDTIRPEDKLISAGSATTNAGALVLKVLAENFGVDYAMFSSVHSYTSDQPLRDKAGSDFRRSRSAAENIIPVDSIAPYWIQHVLPRFEGKVEGFSLHVPVPNGSLLDMTTVMKNSGIQPDDIAKAMTRAAEDLPDIIHVVSDPIVSSDVIDNSHSVVFDKKATMVSAGRILKTLTWYHSAYAMAARIRDLIITYSEIDKKGGKS